MEVDPAQSLTALIERARSAMAGSVQTDEGPFTGSAADGMITTEVGADGRLRSLRIDPKMLRQPLEDVCALIVAAVNEAVDARPTASTGPLLDELRAVQEQSAAQMAQISQAFSTALARAVSK